MFYMFPVFQPKFFFLTGMLGLTRRLPIILPFAYPLSLTRQTCMRVWHTAHVLKALVNGIDRLKDGEHFTVTCSLEHCDNAAPL